MSRFNSSGATNFRIQRLGFDDFRLSWKVDRYYEGSRLRFPRGASRDTDRKGAERFAKKHGVEMPPEPVTIPGKKVPKGYRLLAVGERIQIDDLWLRYVGTTNVRGWTTCYCRGGTVNEEIGPFIRKIEETPADGDPHSA